jgi:pimeloyl-ACP methyl ester carboxylesterase
MVELPSRPPVFLHDVPGPTDAPTVLLLHGLGASATLNWRSAVPSLAEHFRVVAPDHRGHGRTPPAGDFTLSGCADDAFACLDALDISKVIAVGYSMGGPIAQLMWRQQPERIDGLVLAATSRDFGGRVQDRLLFRLLPLLLAASRLPGYHRLRRATLARLVQQLGPQPDPAFVLEELSRSDPRAVVQAASELGRFTSREWISDVDVPTSVIVAMNDQLVPVRRQLKLARSIRDCVAAFVDGDHYSPIEPDADFASVLVHECRGVARRRGTSVRPPPAYWRHIVTDPQGSSDCGNPASYRDARSAPA